jgi:hypothetical protein
MFTSKKCLQKYSPRGKLRYLDRWENFMNICSRCGQKLSNTSMFGSRGALRCLCCDESNDCPHEQTTEAWIYIRPNKIRTKKKDRAAYIVSQNWRLQKRLPHVTAYAAAHGFIE